MVKIRRPASDAGHTDAEPGMPAPTAPLPTAPQPAPPQGPASAGHVLERTRLGGTWVAVGCFAVVLLFLLIFIVENGNSVSVSFFGGHGRLPLGVALVLSAVCGALLVMFAGMARILQFRSRARRHRRAERGAASS
jgi:uncharacterized integral membrane protein